MATTDHSAPRSYQSSGAVLSSRVGLRIMIVLRVLGIEFLKERCGISTLVMLR